MAIKLWNGSTWIEKPSFKVWNGSAWVSKKAHVWNGSAWVDVSTKTLTYNATGSNSLCEKFYDGWRDEVYLIQAMYNEPVGDRSISYIWFDIAQIVSDLAGRTVLTVEVYLERYSGTNGIAGAVPVHVWAHSLASRDAAVNTLAEGDDYLSNEHADVANLAKGIGQWISLNAVVGERLRDGTSKGIAIYVASPHATNDYMRIQGYSESGAPQLRITCL